ncbi:MAG: phosphatidylserine decarboxylase family protein [Bacteroidota bacterium]|nr:phosphatidylserine decarboxylase family protein [Bacteroidota bacterium]MDP4215538.1 phosphatidylserine decarboxylase family protein [Bacteroidota bacterium]MDP4245168.1 phosphatidylserine decarboxylase family protein [Bacteroidota bacterium]MDP4253208.1 phosphatidylserine decarboxylase family protein [Bacteroidota bacterium]MDP4258246.1 phosphatidylserine decarboxylase family protein [Bacteroidota bacterium]
MTVHKEGYKTIAIAALAFALINLPSFHYISPNGQWQWLSWAILLITLAAFLFLISFFRVPNRTPTRGDNLIICPADGKVVVIEEAFDEEYFKDRRLQVSIFMSPANVHRNVNPISGEVVYNQYHRGKYLVAWHPKSSTENERHSVVLRNNHGEILVKQIAGAMARRIVNYLSVGQKIEQSAEMGFIKFGSRVDVLLPPGAKVQVRLNETVKGGVTVLASW